MQWSREEGLAQLSYEDSDPSIVFIEAPSKAAITSASLLLPTLNTFRSILSLPLRAFSLLQPTKELSTRTSRDWLSEAFGYRKLAVFGTQYGKLYALDLGDGGRIVWETYLVPLSVTSGDKVITWKELIAHTRSDGKILLVAIAEIVSADVSTFTASRPLNTERRNGLMLGHRISIACRYLTWMGSPASPC